MTLADFVRNLGTVLYYLMCEIARFGGVRPCILLFLCWAPFGAILAQAEGVL